MTKRTKKRKSATVAKPKKLLFIPDQHIPYNDKNYWKLMMKIVKGFKPDVVAIMGDFADFYAVSSHSKDPNRAANLEYEVDAVNLHLDELEKLLKPGTRKIFIAGNHENRLERYLQDKAPELFNMITIKDLFNLKKRGWEYVSYKDHITVGKLNLTHDTGKAGKYAHYQSAADFQSNVLIGHTHRLGYQVEGNAQGNPHVSAMLGWGGDVKQVDYMHRIKAMRDWALGFGTGYMTKEGNVHVQAIAVVGNKAVVDGVLYSV